MRNIRPSLIAIGLLLVFLAGCSGRPPANTVVELAKAHVAKNPDSFCGFMTRMNDIEYEKIEVVEYGKHNKKEGYYPVRVRLVFSAECKAWTFGGKWQSQGRKHWDKTLDGRLRLHEDDYGKKKWEASW